MGTLRVGLFFLTASLLAAAEPVVRDLGVPIKAVSWVRLHPGRGPDGTPSLLASMGQNNGGLFVLDIDLATGHCRQFNAPSNVDQYPTTSLRSPQTGMLYVAPASDGHLLRYDPAHPERRLEDLGAIDGEHMTFPNGMDEAPDGCIWIGAYPNATLSRFNPATGRITRFGSMDDQDQYIYPLCGIDGTIAGTTNAVHPHIVVLDPATGAHRTVGPVVSPEIEGQHIQFFKGQDGYLYIDSHAGKFRIRGGRADPVSYLPAQMPGTDATYKHAYQEMLPMPGGVIPAWADGDEGAGTGIYRKVLLKGPGIAIPDRTIDLDWRGEGTNIFLIHRGPDGMIYGSSFLPEHLFRCAPDGGGMVNLARCSESLGETYSMGNFSDGTMALASYPSSHISLYDPRRPYHYGTAVGSNPRDVGRLEDVSTRPIAMVIVPALRTRGGREVPERMWIGAAPNYGRWGGTLDWLDPRTLAHGSHRNVVTDCFPYSMLWLPDLRQLLLGITAEGGTSTRPKVGHGAFVLWDPANDEPVYSGDFGIRDLRDVIAMARCDDGRVYALSGNTRYVANLLGAPVSPPRLTLIDPAARRVVADAPLPKGVGEVCEQSQYTLFRGPDGIYGITKTALYRLKPGTCETEVVWRAPKGDALDIPGPWIGRTFYFATGWRLRTLALPPAQPVNSP